jgi:hypothetical protein
MHRAAPTVCPMWVVWGVNYGGPASESWRHRGVSIPHAKLVVEVRALLRNVPLDWARHSSNIGCYMWIVWRSFMRCRFAWWWYHFAPVVGGVLSWAGLRFDWFRRRCDRRWTVLIVYRIMWLCVCVCVCVVYNSILSVQRRVRCGRLCMAPIATFLIDVLLRCFHCHLLVANLPGVCE